MNEHVDNSINSIPLLRREEREKYMKDVVVVNVVHNNNKFSNMTKEECPICMNPLNSRNIGVANCNHKICTNCLKECFARTTGCENVRCCICRQNIQTITVKTKKNMKSLNTIVKTTPEKMIALKENWKWMDDNVHDVKRSPTMSEFVNTLQIVIHKFGVTSIEREDYVKNVIRLKQHEKLNG